METATHLSKLFAGIATSRSCLIPYAVQENRADMPQLCIGHESPILSSRVK